MVRVLVLARDNKYAERAIMLAPVRLSVRHGVDQLKTIEAMIMQLLLFSRFMRQYLENGRRYVHSCY